METNEMPEKIYINPNLENRIWLMGKADTSFIEYVRTNKLIEYINEERNKKGFYFNGEEVSWNEIPLNVRKHDYPYYFKGELDCFPFEV